MTELLEAGTVCYTSAVGATIGRDSVRALAENLPWLWGVATGLPHCMVTGFQRKPARVYDLSLTISSVFVPGSPAGTWAPAPLGWNDSCERTPL